MISSVENCFREHCVSTVTASCLKRYSAAFSITIFTDHLMSEADNSTPVSYHRGPGWFSVFRDLTELTIQLSAISKLKCKQHVHSFVDVCLISVRVKVIIDMLSPYFRATFEFPDKPVLYKSCKF